MNFEKTIAVRTSIDEAWNFLMDMPAVGNCVPGLESIETIDDDHYRGKMKIKVAAIRVAFDGDIKVLDRDRASRKARMEAKGSDKRMGSAVTATVDMHLREAEGDQVEMTVISEAAVFGKLGELGQAVMLRKADQVMAQFAANLAERLEGDRAPVATADHGFGTSAAPAGTGARPAGPDPVAGDRGGTASTGRDRGRRTLWQRLLAWFGGGRTR